MRPIKVLTIAGSDSSGGAGIQADLKTITVLGGFGMSVITALTAQNGRGVGDIYEVSPDFVDKQFEAVMTTLGVDAAKTGMMASVGIMRAVAENIRKYGIEKVVVDPVMLAKDGVPLIHGDFRELMIKKLIPVAFVITPNIPEAEFLSGIKIKSVHEMDEAARIIFDFGARHVVIKGGHLPGDAVDVLYDGRRIERFTVKRIDNKASVHGTGCTFSAAIATFLAKGMTVSEALNSAKMYITEVIKNSFHIGNGCNLIDHSLSLLGETDERTAG